MNARRTLLKAAAALPWRDRWRCTAWLWHTGRGHRLQALLNTSLGVASVLTALLFVWATKLTVDIATHADHRLTLTQALALLSGLALVEILLGVASRWVRALLGVKAQNALRATLFAHLLRCEWQGLKAYHSGDLLNRMEKEKFFSVETGREMRHAVFLYLQGGLLASLIFFIVPVLSAL